jgi:hypothetical protein
VISHYSGPVTRDDEQRIAGRGVTQADVFALTDICSLLFRKNAKVLVVGPGGQPANPMT